MPSFPAKTCFWLTLGAVTLLALLPQPAAPVPGTPGFVQHLLAFAVLSALLPFAHPRLGLPAMALLLAGYGGLIELAQLASALGRTAELWDWLVDLAAIAAVLPAATWLRRRGAPDSASSRAASPVASRGEG